MAQSSDIDAWRRVHRQLTLALMQSRDNIAAELTKRRYLLEEMNRCKMQNAQKSAPGSSSSSKMKKKAAPKKVVPKKAPAVAVKVKKVTTSPAVSANVTNIVPPKVITSKAAVHSKLGGLSSAALVKEAAGMASIVAPPTVTGIGDGGSSDKQNEISNNVHGGDEVLRPNVGISSQQMSQMYYPPNPYGMGMATPQQMALAVQMMQQINQNAANDGDDSDTEV